MDGGQINTVQNTLVQFGILGNFFGEKFQYINDFAIFRTFDNNDDFVVIAEFFDVIEPVLIKTAIGIDEIKPAHFESEVLRSPIETKRGDENGQHQHYSRIPATEQSQ